ncbi:MAG: hypothetical protein LBL60_02115 [Mycoplasmataceae bacterium]|jgi:transposase-like protein|nr:hypothetical protein [Mycoplasmataceae bacterium]
MQINYTNVQEIQNQITNFLNKDEIDVLLSRLTITGKVKLQESIFNKLFKYDQPNICPHCGSIKTHKFGFKDGKQRLICNYFKHTFEFSLKFFV